MRSTVITKTRADVASAVALKHDLRAKDAKEVTNTVIDVIASLLEQGYDLSLRRFCNMKQIVRKEKIGQNISKGRSVVIPAKNTIKFIIADELEKKLNKA